MGELPHSRLRGARLHESAALEFVQLPARRIRRHTEGRRQRAWTARTVLFEMAEDEQSPQVRVSGEVSNENGMDLFPGLLVGTDPIAHLRRCAIGVRRTQRAFQECLQFA